jgi:hypothetical protein
VPYRIHTAYGVQTVLVDQKPGVSGNQWNFLGNFPFLAGNAWVDVSDTGLASGEFVSADAVRWVRTAPLPVSLSRFDIE